MCSSWSAALCHWGCWGQTLLQWCLGAWCEYLFMDSTWYIWPATSREVFSHCDCHRLGYCHLWRVTESFCFASAASVLNTASHNLHVSLNSILYVCMHACMCRCREDERPLNQLLVLQLGAEHPNGRYNISMCKIFGQHWNQEKRRFLPGSEDISVTKLFTLKMQTLDLLLNMPVQVGRVINFFLWSSQCFWETMK
jgi:hypothetical protein